MLQKLIVRRGFTVPNRLTWPSTKNSFGTKTYVTTGSLNGCSIQPETKFVSTRVCVDTARVLCVGRFLTLLELPVRGQCLTSNSLQGLHSWIFLKVISWHHYHEGILPHDIGGLKSESSISKVSYQWRCTSPANLLVIPPSTLPQHVLFAYQQVIRPNFPWNSLGTVTARIASNCPVPQAKIYIHMHDFKTKLNFVDEYLHMYEINVQWYIFLINASLCKICN